MKIGFIGAGAVAQTISRHLLPLGHKVVLSNSRGKASLEDVVQRLGRGASAGTTVQAADQDMVVLAVAWSAVEAALRTVPDWSGRVLVDATNRVASFDPFSLGDLTGPTSSEVVANLAPGATVLKAFNSVPMAWIDDVSTSKPKTVLFLSGDSDEAKRPLSNLLEEAGFSCVDLGGLALGGRLQQLGGPLAGLRLNLLERLSL
jgi:8-hydroxy-5-deazaflavin:NADPH oxidoreductase